MGISFRGAVEVKGKHFYARAISAAMYSSYTNQVISPEELHILRQFVPNGARDVIPGSRVLTLGGFSSSLEVAIVDMSKNPTKGSSVAVVHTSHVVASSLHLFLSTSLLLSDFIEHGFVFGFGKKIVCFDVAHDSYISLLLSPVKTASPVWRMLSVVDCLSQLSDGRSAINLAADAQPCNLAQRQNMEVGIVAALLVRQKLLDFLGRDNLVADQVDAFASHLTIFSLALASISDILVSQIQARLIGRELRITILVKNRLASITLGIIGNNVIFLDA
jgi:hypothetical protein